MLILAATIRDVAKFAGVSVATVSRVINRLGGVKSETENRILEAMQKLHYIPNVLARSVASQKNTLIGMVIPDIGNPFFAQVYSEVNKIVRKFSYTTFLGDSEDDWNREEELLQIMLEHRASGIILTPTNENGDWLQRLHFDIPICLVDRNLEGIDCDRVLIDNRLGAYEATRLFVENGHERIGIITGPLSSTPGKERFEGYRSCLQDNGLELDDEFIQVGDFREGSGFNLGRKLLSNKRPPTAILSCNNLMTMGLLEAINFSSFQIGTDISVIGFDDIPIATLMTPKLTVVSRPMREMGEWAAKLLLKRIENPNVPKQFVMMTPHLIVRGSERKGL